jgi:hypothetical protein
VRAREAAGVSAPLYRLKADFHTTLGHPAHTRVAELLADREHAIAEMLPQVRPGMGSSGRCRA